jgi:hypothetical protein
MRGFPELLGAGFGGVGQRIMLFRFGLRWRAVRGPRELAEWIVATSASAGGATGFEAQVSKPRFRTRSAPIGQGGRATGSTKRFASEGHAVRTTVWCRR